MCNHCNLVNCSILNKSECPINKLWEQEQNRINKLLTQTYGIDLKPLIDNVNSEYFCKN
jgi:hypothetical protein